MEVYISTDLQPRRWMMNTMPRYEVRYDENGEWIEVSDLDFMDGLYKLYRRIAPVIKEMINGKEIRTPDAVYRLKWQFENPRMTKIDSKRSSIFNIKPHGDLCIYCNKTYYYGEWRNADDIDHKFMPSEIKKTICQNCSFERFPKFYMSKNSLKASRTKRNVPKFYSSFKRALQREKTGI